jgi:hypothetical protein
MPINAITPYLTIAEAQVYFDQRLNTECWDDASTEDRDAALAQATREIDKINFRGKKTSTAQERPFPRDDDSAVPQEVLEAVCEEVLTLLEEIDARKEFENLNLVSQGYANVRSTYDRGSLPAHVLVGLTSAVAYMKLKPYIRDGKNIDVNRVS